MQKRFQLKWNGYDIVILRLIVCLFLLSYSILSDIWPINFRNSALFTNFPF